ncbi:MAG TPA: PsiF family protein [Steroidobacteraceae bacterium]
MKAIATFAMTAALLLGSAAFAQTNNTTNTGQPDSATMQANPPSNTGSTTGSSTATDPSASSQSVAAACKKQATDLKLHGSDKTKFMKDCKEGKTSREGRTNPPPQ